MTAISSSPICITCCSAAWSSRCSRRSTTGRRPSARGPSRSGWGTWAFGLIFAGFNIAFLPMHVTGLIGMPRRVYTYPAGMGWDTLNLVSTLGAFMLAAGVLVFLIDVARNLRLTGREPAGDVWRPVRWNGCQTSFGTRSTPRDHEPRAALGRKRILARRRSRALLPAAAPRPAGARRS
jgi:heme/copper-type cytochrome/quinol oxidase subunit 1